MYKGQLTGFPEEVVEKMLDRQVEQGNPRDVKVFEEYVCAGSNTGFDWEDTTEGYAFWMNVIDNKSFEIFFERYPKSDSQQTESALSSPKVMLVSNEPFSNINRGKERVVFHYQSNIEYPYFAYSTDSLDNVKESNMTYSSWRYAKDIEPEPDDFPAELQVILDEKANNNNHIDLDAYANGLLDCYNKLVKK